MTACTWILTATWVVYWLMIQNSVLFVQIFTAGTIMWTWGSTIRIPGGCASDWATMPGFVINYQPYLFQCSNNWFATHMLGNWELNSSHEEHITTLNKTKFFDPLVFLLLIPFQKLYKNGIGTTVVSLGPWLAMIQTDMILIVWRKRVQDYR